MNDDLIFLLNDSLHDIEKDLSQALKENNKEAMKYNFLRLFRLLGKIDKSVAEALRKQATLKASHFFKLRNKTVQKISLAYANIAFYLRKSGDFESSEREWLSVISFASDNPEFYIQYAHTALRNYGLAVNKDISENMQLVNQHNICGVLSCLKRVRYAVKSAVSEEGMNEANGYLLTWLDLMDRAIVERKDLVKAMKQPFVEITLESTLNELQQLIGMETVKRKIKEICDWVKFTQMRQEKGLKTDEISLHMVFSGNPGTGKTTVARILARIYKSLGILKKGHLVEAARPDLVAEYVGQTAIKTMKKIKEAEDGVLFIDEAYSLARSTGNDFGIEAIDTLVKAMEDKRQNLIVVLAGYPEEMERFIQSNPGLYSRFKFHIDFPDYSIEELMDIHDFILKEKQYFITEKGSEMVRRILERKIRETPDHHGNGRLVRNIIEDEILNKAAYVVEMEAKQKPVGELDIIDETIMRMVEKDQESDDGRNNRSDKRIIGYIGKA